MRKTLLVAAAATLTLGLAASAQAKFGDLTMSTDPAKAAAVEQHAQELKAHEMHARSHHASMHWTRHHARHAAHLKHPTSPAPAKS